MADVSDYTLWGGYGGNWYANSYKAGYYQDITTVTYPYQAKGYKIVFYTKAGAKVGEISSEVQNSVLIGANFELLVNGCGKFELELSELPSPLSDVTYNYRVDIHLFGDTSPWYSGYIIKIPQSGTTESTLKYSGFGFYNQLQDIMINASYTTDQVSVIVKDLMTEYIESGTDIVYNVDKIEDTSYEVQSINWDRVFAKDCLKQLSELYLGFEFGVDEDRELFFRAKDVDVYDIARLWVSQNIQTFIPQEDIDKVRNKLHIYGGEVTGGAGSKTNFVTTVEDATSQAAYGVKEDKLTIPSVLDSTDATQWGNYKLTELKDPVQKAKVSGIELTKTRINARGKAKITSVDGLHEFTLPIKKVKYKLASKGITADLELGEKDVFFSAEQLKLMQRITTEESLSEQNLLQS